MSAEVLRQAAALMRERANATTSGPWIALEGGVEGAGTVFNDPHALHNDATHIASWHPAVALAVADWLEAEAGKQTPTTHLAVTFDGKPMFPIDPAALAVARAYFA